MQKKNKTIRFFWVIVILLGIYNFVIPLRVAPLNISYSAIIVADDPNNTIIGTINAVNFQQDTLRKVNIPEIDLVPDRLRKTIIASEDRSFFESWRRWVGFNFRGVARALIKNDGGGSGIEQQLTRTLFLAYPYHNNFNRKVTELLIGINASISYSREDLFLAYVNNVPFTGNISGFRTAAAHYFGKTPSQLNWGETATLVGALRKPSALNSNLTAGKFRDAVLLDLLHEGHISEKEYTIAKSRLVSLKSLDPERKNKPFFSSDNTEQESFFVRYAVDEVRKILGPQTNLQGLRIVTTFQPNVQEAAEKAVSNFNGSFPSHLRRPQTGLVSVDYKTGMIRAMIGANPLLDPNGRGTNHATNPRQAGSTFKPFAYGALIQKKNWNLENTLPDYPIAPLQWNPSNYNGTYSSQDLSIGTCLAQSLNIPTANMVKMKLVTPKEVISFARACGISTRNLPNDAPLVLGSGDVTALDLAFAYGTLANNGARNGVRSRPFTVKQIRNSDNEELYNYSRHVTSVSVKEVSKRTSGLLKKALSEVVGNGTGQVIKNYYKKYAAGKTGTTSSHRDVWFVGFNESLSTAVWAGYDDRSPLPEGYNTGGTVSAVIWGNMMANIKPVAQGKRRRN